METEANPSNNAKTDTRNENLTCWRTATGPQCLRVETTNEVHLFVYGYFQYAKFAQQNGKEVVQIQFQDRFVMVKGEHLEPLCEALARLAVERIWVRPEKYKGLGKDDGVIEDIEIKKSNEKTA